MGSKKKVRGAATPSGKVELPGGEPESPADAEEMDPAVLAWLRLAVEALAVFLVAFAFFTHLQSLSKYVIAVDAYFHQKMAVLIRDHGPVRDFPWTQTSVFKTHFSDSSFLFHVLLIPFTFVTDEVVGIKMAAVFFDVVFVTIFYMILRVNRARVPFLFVILLCSCGSLFMYRLCQSRGYLLSMSLSLVTLEACLNKRYRLLALMGFLYPLSYTAFQVVIVIPVIHNIAELMNGERFDRKLVPYASLGALAGLLLHPNFPQDLYLWWVQNIKVMWFKWTSDVNLFFGGELYPPELGFLTKSTTALFVVMIVCGIATVVSTRRRETSTITLFGTTLFFGLLTLGSKRFIEYSAPFGVLYAAFLFRDLVSDEDVETCSTRYPTGFNVVVFLVVAAVGGLLYHSYKDVKRDLENEPEPGLKNAALWLKAHAKKNDIVFTADWDDFPQMFYYNTEQRFLICLDPMFFYSYDPDLWKLWTDTSNVRTQDVYNTIKLRFGAKWVLATNDFGNLIKKCNGDPRFRRQYTDKDVTIFELLDELPDFLTQWSISTWYPNDRMNASEPMVLGHLAKPDAPLPPDGGVALTVAWRTWPAAERGTFLDLERLFNLDQPYLHAYAATRIGSPVEQDADLRIGFDDGVTVWLDGKQLLDDKGPNEVTLDGRKISLKLPKGTSTLCVRCTNHKGNWGFMARLTPSKQAITSVPFQGR